MNDLNFDDPVIFGKVITAFRHVLRFPIKFRQVYREILKESLRLRKIAFQALTLEEQYLSDCVQFVEHLVRETDIDLKQEIFNYVEHRIDNYQPLTEPTVLMWYEFSQAFATLREDPIIGIRSTRLYDYTYAKWQADYELVLAKFSHGSHACDYDRYIGELKFCGDERALSIMDIMVRHNEIHGDDYDDNGAGGPRRYAYGYYEGAESARKAILQRINNIYSIEAELLRLLAYRGNDTDGYQLQKLNDLDLEDPVIVSKVITAFGDAFQFPQVHREILKQSLKLRQIAVRALLEDPCLHHCVPSVEHLAQETDIDLKQEIFNYVEHRIDNYQLPTARTMLMWYEFAQAFAVLREDPIIGIRSTRLYDYTYAKWQADYELVLSKDAHESHTFPYYLYINELELCGDERALPIIEGMVADNKRYYDDYDNGVAGAPPRYFAHYNYGAEDAREAIVQRVHTIDLSGQNLTEIPVIIYEFKNLTSLNLSNNKITEIPAAIGKLTNLTDLNLQDNWLISISPEIGNLNNLTSLNLNSNITSEGLFAISKLTNLTSLKLVTSDIPADIGNLTSLTKLIILGQFTKIPATIGKLKNLISLEMRCPKVSEIPTEISELTKLIFLKITWAKLTKIPIEICNLSNLTYFDLCHNKIDEIPKGIDRLKKLATLILRSNSILKISPEIGILKNLSVLDLSSNCISEIPPEIGELENLNTLDVRSNKIVNISAEIGKLKKLVRLNLSGNQIVQLPATIVNLHHLNELYVSGNPLEDSSETIDKLESLTHLDISNTTSVFIPTKNSKLKNLTNLTLSNSQIVTLAAAIDKLPSLTHLTSYIWVCDLPAEIGKLTNLTYLNLSDTYISNIPPEIGELKQLTYLNLSENKIKKIPPEIGRLKNLTKLILNKNFITDIPTEIGELKYLIELNLEDNLIAEVPQFISSIEHLQFLSSYRLNYLEPTC
ncbi:leucine-rich repeat domain-containing protein [Chamaesiphon sp. VAR_48_metabat_135_sub]|uniref:leucine-rich repeat domain-containing protein n=1 Tax=Chamaesiphon sp. VAR_48_metabat_135_sub TaxID=2964699 RepID=UPI00286A5F38|nr:leucine-rich repeat domain-containing protein [Chamaesiphon sp. VAR_48_metabat_135_sub]